MTNPRSNSTFRSLRSSNFRRFFIGQLLSQNGTWAQLVAIDLLVYRLTDSGTAVGLATAARFAGALLLGPWAGLLSDRTDRLKLLWWTSLAGLAVAAAFTAIVGLGYHDVRLILLTALLAGFVTAIENPARRVFVSELVPPELATNAVALNSAIITGGRITGPAVAGLLISQFGITWCFALNAVTFLPQLVLLRRIDVAQIRSSGTVKAEPGQFREGLRYIWRTSQLRVAMIAMTCISTFTFHYAVVLPLFATRDLGGDERSYTLLLSTMSIGSLLGTFVIARRTRITTDTIRHTAYLLGAATLGLAFAPNVAVATIAVVPVGMGTLMLVAGSNSLAQLVAEPAMRGRVMAMVAVTFAGTTPIGGPIVGTLAEAFGARTSLAFAGTMAIVTGLGMAVLDPDRSRPDRSGSTTAAP